MNVLVIGNGGREHALVWKLKQSPKVSKIYCTIGNPGIDEIAEPVSVKPDNIFGLLDFAKKNKIDLTVVGPEVPLSLGIVDQFNQSGLMIFGPTKAAALLETSKVASKSFMKKYGIPTAAFETFILQEKDKMLEYLKSINYPVVLKADGLAAGKGVIICSDNKEAETAVKQIFDEKIFGKSGDKIVAEEYLTGTEASVFAVCDGKDYVLLPSAQDHKKISDGETGKNTGGMGSFAPADNIVTTEILNKVKTRIIEPVLSNMSKDGNPYKGCLYCGLMIRGDEPYVIEFNARFGDPETQVVLPLISSDLYELLYKSAGGELKNYKIETVNKFYCLVVLASEGYPDKYETGKIIEGLKNNMPEDILIFHAGTMMDDNNNVLTNGGRVLNVIGSSDVSLQDAIKKVYDFIPNIKFEKMYFRKDIGMKGLQTI